MEQVKFSVALCVYNGDDGSNFDSALDSIYNQTIKPNEIVLIVDGPINSELEKIVGKYCGISDIKLEVFRFEKNVGHGIARRKSIELCKYDYIAIMDSDDLCRTNRFEKQIEYLSKYPKVDVLGGQISEFIGTPSNVIGIRSVKTQHEEICNDMKKRCPFNQVTIIFKRSSYEKAGGYLDWYHNEDYYLWIRMFLKKCIFANIEDIFVDVRMNDDSYFRRGGLKYFLSEYRIQKLLYSNKINNKFQFLVNVFTRYMIQMLFPNKLRRFIFIHFARK